VSFSKTVATTAGSAGTATLDDTASLFGDDPLVALATANATVNISSARSSTLTINKTIPTGILTGAETAEFDFQVLNGAVVVATTSIAFAAGETSDSAVVSGLTFGVNYTVRELPETGWDAKADQTTGAIGCAGSVTFNNTVGKARADVTKVTVPAGSEAGWTFTLTGPGLPAAGVTATTTGAGAINFGVDLGEGTYTVTETAKVGFDQTTPAGACTFTVDFPADAGRTFHCTFTNTQRGTIIVRKETNPDGAAKVFEYTVTGGLADFSLSDGQNSTQTNLVPGGYSVREDLPVVGWSFTSLTCTTTGSGTSVTRTGALATMTLGPGGTIDCTYVNTQQARARLFKTINGQAIPVGTLPILFQLRTGASTSAQGTTLNQVSVDSNSVFPLDLRGDFLDPGTYQVCEFVLPGWDSTIAGMPGAFVPGSLADPANVDNAYVCAPITLAAGQTLTLTIDNTPPPGGMAKTIGFWKNWASCSSSNGKQRPILDQTLALAPIAPNQTTHGFYIGDEYVDTCAEAVKLLNKTDLSGKKQASLPEFNFASQATAYQLNLLAGAADDPQAAAAFAAGQAILDENGFIGNALPKSGANALTAAEKAALNTYAGILDKYNNNAL
jgi:hypothetical protein